MINKVNRNKKCRLLLPKVKFYNKLKKVRNVTEISIRLKRNKKIKQKRNRNYQNQF